MAIRTVSARYSRHIVSLTTILITLQSSLLFIPTSDYGIILCYSEVFIKEVPDVLCSDVVFMGTGYSAYPYDVRLDKRNPSM